MVHVATGWQQLEHLTALKLTLTHYTPTAQHSTTFQQNHAHQAASAGDEEPDDTGGNWAAQGITC